MRANTQPAARRTSTANPSSASISVATLEKVLGMTVAEAQPRYDRLSSRQRQVAGLLARGLKNKTIAEQLGISPKTLDIHRADVYYRLKVQTQAAVARIVFLVELAGKPAPSR